MAVDRDTVTDRLFIDKSSNKLIVSGPASGMSAYNTLAKDSALASNALGLSVRRSHALNPVKNERDQVRFHAVGQTAAISHNDKTRIDIVNRI